MSTVLNVQVLNVKMLNVQRLNVPEPHDTKFEVVQLWVYEVFRTFRDRMTDTEAEGDVIEIVRKETKKAFNMDFDSVCEDEENFEPPLFGNILDT